VKTTRTLLETENHLGKQLENLENNRKNQLEEQTARTVLAIPLQL